MSLIILDTSDREIPIFVSCTMDLSAMGNLANELLLYLSIFRQLDTDKVPMWFIVHPHAKVVLYFITEL